MSVISGSGSCIELLGKGALNVIWLHGIDQEAPYFPCPTSSGPAGISITSMPLQGVCDPFRISVTEAGSGKLYETI